MAEKEQSGALARPRADRDAVARSLGTIQDVFDENARLEMEVKRLREETKYLAGQVTALGNENRFLRHERDACRDAVTAAGAVVQGLETQIATARQSLISAEQGCAAFDPNTQPLTGDEPCDDVIKRYAPNAPTNLPAPIQGAAE